MRVTIPNVFQRLRAIDDIVIIKRDVYDDSFLLVKHGRYKGNNPYFINTLNNIFKRGKLESDDVVIIGDNLKLGESSGRPYLDSEILARISYDINDDTNDISNANNEKIYEAQQKTY